MKLPLFLPVLVSRRRWEAIVLELRVLREAFQLISEAGTLPRIHTLKFPHIEVDGDPHGMN